MGKKRSAEPGVHAEKKPAKTRVNNAATGNGCDPTLRNGNSGTTPGAAPQVVDVKTHAMSVGTPPDAAQVVHPKTEKRKKRSRADPALPEDGSRAVLSEVVSKAPTAQPAGDGQAPDAQAADGKKPKKKKRKLLQNGAAEGAAPMLSTDAAQAPSKHADGPPEPTLAEEKSPKDQKPKNKKSKRKQDVSAAGAPVAKTNGALAGTNASLAQEHPSGTEDQHQVQGKACTDSQPSKKKSKAKKVNKDQIDGAAGTGAGATDQQEGGPDARDTPKKKQKKKSSKSTGAGNPEQRSAGDNLGSDAGIDACAAQVTKQPCAPAEAPASHAPELNGTLPTSAAVASHAMQPAGANGGIAPEEPTVAKHKKKKKRDQVSGAEDHVGLNGSGGLPGKQGADGAAGAVCNNEAAQQALEADTAADKSRRSADAAPGASSQAEGNAGRSFRRVKSEEWLGKQGATDNTYEGTFGDSGWGYKAQQVLGRVRGRDFRHEKTKKKRGSYMGGKIDPNACFSIKFD